MEKIGRLIFASSAENADILYASGFDGHDPFFYFEVEERRGIVVPRLERGRAISEAKPGVEVFEFEEIIPEGERYSSEKIVEELSRRFGVDAWIVPRSFPCGLAYSLRDRGEDVEPAPDPFIPERRSKSDDEIKAISRALELAENALGKVADILAASAVDSDGTLRFEGETLTSERLKFEIAVEVLRGGGNASDTIAACGKDASQPHNSGSGPIMAEKPIVVDIFPKGERGYHGDITRTFLKGKAPEIVARAFDAVREARDAAIAVAAADAETAELHRAADAILKRHGFETERRGDIHVGFFHGLGHGVGLDVHEPPRVSDKSGDVLREGDVVTIEPGLYYPEWGGVRLEDMVAIRNGDAENLTKFPTFLEIE